MASKTNKNAVSPPPNRPPPRKLDRDKLRVYVEQNPDAYLAGIAEQFNCTAPAVFYALKSIGMTYKKDNDLQRTRPSKSSKLFIPTKVCSQSGNGIITPIFKSNTKIKTEHKYILLSIRMETRLIDMVGDAQYFIADKVYDAEYIRDKVRQCNMIPVIPRRKILKQTNTDFDRYLYRLRHLV